MDPSLEHETEDRKREIMEKKMEETQEARHAKLLHKLLIKIEPYVQGVDQGESKRRTSGPDSPPLPKKSKAEPKKASKSGNSKKRSLAFWKKRRTDGQSVDCMHDKLLLQSRLSLTTWPLLQSPPFPSFPPLLTFLCSNYLFDIGH